MMMTNTANPLPWYKFPIVWLVVGIPATAVVTGIALLTLSIKHHDGLVVDDYYKQGLGINKVILRQGNAAERGLNGSIKLDPLTNAVTVELRSLENYPLQGTIKLGLYHSTHDDADQVTDLFEVSKGVYAGKLSPVSSGRWNIVLEQEDWRLDGSLFQQQGDELVQIELVPSQG